MIWSVSTLLRRSGSAEPGCLVKASICSSSRVGVSGQVGGAREVSRDRGGCCHRDGHEVGAPALALTPFEVAVGGRGAPLAGRQLVGVHPQAHRAPGTTPLGTG